MKLYTYIRRWLALVAFVLLAATAMAQGKGIPSEDLLDHQAHELYDQGRYKEACDMLLKSADRHAAQQHSRIMVGLTIFLLVDIIGVFFFLYLEKRKAYKLLVEKNADCAGRPLFDPDTIDFSPEAASEESDRAILENLHHLFEKEKIYLDGDLKIEQVAQRLGTNKMVVSKLVNQYLGRSFPALVNQYRIGEAVRLLMDPKTGKYKLEVIGQLCGYNNRQVFHAAFKKETGITPLEFKQAKTEYGES